MDIINRKKTILANRFGLKLLVPIFVHMRFNSIVYVTEMFALVSHK